MRPLFAINFAAGLTLGFALVFAVAQSYGAFRTSRALEKLGPNAVDVEPLKRDVEDYFSGAIRSGCVAILQVPILIYARRLGREVKAR